MSRTSIVFIFFLLVVISLMTLAYLGIISKNIAGCAIVPLVVGFAIHKLQDKNDKSVSMWKIMEGKVKDSELL
jgi:hypothetical protein